MSIEMSIGDLSCSLKSVEYADIKCLVESIRDVGILVPFRIDKEKNIIDGRNRLYAAWHLGIKKIPVVIVESSIGEIFIIGIFDGFKKYKKEEISC